MPYVVQAEEREIDLDLLQKLAEALLAGAPDLTFGDATYRIRRAGGLLQVPARAEAERICARFNALGLCSFVVEKLLELPRPERLNLEKPDLGGEVELVVVGWLHLVTEKVVRTTKVGLSGLGLLAGVPIPTRKTEEKKVEDTDTRYCLDVFTATKHWRAQSGFPQPLRELLAQETTPNTLLSAGAQSLARGERNLARFEREADYEKYVTWLYQLRYARNA